jgi:hypothetical protein
MNLVTLRCRALMLTALALIVMGCGQVPTPTPPPVIPRDTVAATPMAPASSTPQADDVPSIFAMNGEARLAYVERLGQSIEMQQALEGGTITLHWVGLNAEHAFVYLSATAKPGFVVVPLLPNQELLTAADGTILNLLGGTGTPGVAAMECATIEEFDATLVDSSPGTISFHFMIPEVPLIAISAGPQFALGNTITPDQLSNVALPGPVTFDFTLDVASADGTSTGRSQSISLPSSAALPTKEAASQWAVGFASPDDGPPARVLDAQLMSLAEAMGQDVDGSWSHAVPESLDFSTPDWVIEVDGAEIVLPCPPSVKVPCVATHVVLVVNALTGKWIGWNYPHSGPATPSP